MPSPEKIICKLKTFTRALLVILVKFIMSVPTPTFSPFGCMAHKAFLQYYDIMQNRNFMSNTKLKCYSSEKLLNKRRRQWKNVLSSHIQDGTAINGHPSSGYSGKLDKLLSCMQSRQCAIHLFFHERVRFIYRTFLQNLVL